MKESFNLDYLNQKYPNHNINVEKSSKIKGSGGYGNIFPFSLFFNKKNKSGNSYCESENRVFKKRDFVIKVFNDIEIFNHSLKIFDFLKSNKITTFKNYRKYEYNCVIMEDLSLDNNFCVSPNNAESSLNKDAQYLKENKIDEILNFDEFLENGFKVCENLTSINFGIYSSDAFLFLGKKSKCINLKFIVGDFDNCHLRYSSSNYLQFCFSVENFLLEFVDKKNCQSYINYLNKFKDNFENNKNQREIIKKNVEVKN